MNYREQGDTICHIRLVPQITGYVAGPLKTVGMGFELNGQELPSHDDVIKWKHFPRHWPFVRGTHRSPVDSPLKGQ